MATIIVCDKFTELERHDSSCLIDFLRSIENYNEDVTPFAATINGELFTDFDRQLQESDVVRLTLEPRDPFTAILVVTAIISAGVAYYTYSNMPKGYEDTSQRGKSIYAAGTNANTATPNGYVREMFGGVSIFPDLLTQPHRRYDNNNEYLYLGLGVGAGHIDLQEKNIYAAETPIRSYQDSITSYIREPDQSNSGITAFENWFQSKEVSGLRLLTQSTPEYGDWTVDYSGATITSYLGGVATAFPFVAGERFNIDGGSNPGYYEVASISGGSNEIATVTSLDRDNENTARIGAMSQSLAISALGRITGAKRVVRNNFTAIGSAAFTPATGEAIGWQSVSGGVNWEGPFQVTPINELSRYAEVDIRFPQGLGDLDNDGELKNATVDIAVQWRAVGTGSWNTVAGTSYTDATYDEKGITIDIDFGSEIRPEFQYRRITPDSDSTTLADIIEVVRVKCLLNSPTSYPITTLGMKILGTNALAVTAENRINIRGAKRKLPTIAELEANSWDLSNAATQSDTGYIVTDSEFISSMQVTGIGESPASSAFALSSDVGASGTKIVTLTGSGGIATFWHAEDAYNPVGGLIPNGYIYLGVGMTNKAVRLSGNDTYVSYLFKAPSNIFFVTSQPITLPASAGEVALNGSSTGYQLPLAITAGESFYIYPDGSRFYVLENDGAVHQYNVGTPHDLSTSTDPSISFDASTELGANNAVSVWLTDYSDGSDPARLYISDDAGNIYQYTLGTPGNISTASYDGYTFQPNEIPSSIHITKTDLFSFGASSGEGFAAMYKLQDIVDSRATRSVARAVGYAARESMGANADNYVDWGKLSTLDSTLESRGDYLDAEFVDETTLWEAMKIMCSPGYCEPTLKSGKLTPARIVAGIDYEEIYTPDIMKGDGLQIDSVQYDGNEPDGIDVEYFSTETNGMEIVECRAPGDLGLNVNTVQATGITDETKAWRFGMRERNRLRYKPDTLRFETELDALNSNYGDPIAVASEVFQSQYGEVVDYSAPTVTLDFDPVFGVGTHYAAFRTREGKFSGLYTVIAGGSPNEITLASPSTLDFVPVFDGSMDSTMATFGPADEIAKRAIVRNISPSDETSVEITAEEYVAEVYQDDDNAPS